MQGFRRAQQEYERKLFAPYDDLPMTEEEYEEKCDVEITRAEALMEEQWLKEKGLL